MIIDFFKIVIKTQIDPDIFKGYEYGHYSNCKINYSSVFMTIDIMKHENKF